MRGDTDGSGLIGDPLNDILFDPPDGVCAEFMTEVRIEFVDGAHQPEVALLNNVVERNASVAEFAGDTDDQTEVIFEDFVFERG